MEVLSDSQHREKIPDVMPHVYVLCGLQGSGKSTVGQLVAERIDAEILKTDRIRKELFPDPQYTSQERQAVYDEMFRRATEKVSKGKRVVLDATFLTERQRAQALHIAEENGVEARIIKVEANDETTKRRLNDRSGDDSTATYEIYLKEKSNFEEIKEKHLLVNNSGTLDQLKQTISQYFPLEHN